MLLAPADVLKCSQDFLKYHSILFDPYKCDITVSTFLMYNSYELVKFDTALGLRFEFFSTTL